MIYIMCIYIYIYMCICMYIYIIYIYIYYSTCIMIYDMTKQYYNILNILNIL